MSLVERSLADLIDIHDQLRIPLSGVEREKRQGDFPYYGAQSIIDYIDAYIFDGEYVLVAEDGENLRSRKQPIAQIASGKFWVNNHAHILTAVDGVSTNAFLSALINWIDISPYVTGAAQPKLSQGSLKSIKVRVPNYETQLQISEVLGGYDDLIETNRRRIALLEEAARLLYREWFVNLRFPGHEQSKMVDGLPPKWRRVRLAEICEQEREQVNPASVAPGTYYLSMEHMTSKSICLGMWETAEKVSSSKVRFQRGDILFGRIRPYFHKVGIAQVDGITSTDMIVVRAKSRNLQPIVALAMSSDEFVGYAVTTSNGTKMPRADWKVLKNWEVVLPNEDVLADFAERLMPIFESLDVLSGQNIVLEKARDELLPKLMSGEIQV